MDRKQIEKQRYNELLKKGLKPSEALHRIEAERQETHEERRYKEHTDEYGEKEIPEEKAYRQAKEDISRKYGKIKAVVGEIKAGIPKIASKKSLVKTGRFVAGAVLLAPGDIKANLRRNKAIKTGARKAYIKSRKEELSLRKQEIDIRKQELAIEKARMQPQRPVIYRTKLTMQPSRMVEMTKEDAFDMGSIFNTGGDLIGNIGRKKKKSGSSDPFGLSGFF